MLAKTNYHSTYFHWFLSWPIMTIRMISIHDTTINHCGGSIPWKIWANLREIERLGEFLCGRTVWSRTTPEWSRPSKWSRLCIFTLRKWLRLVARTQVVAHLLRMVAHTQALDFAANLLKIHLACFLAQILTFIYTMRVNWEGISFYRVT